MKIMKNQDEKVVEKNEKKNLESEFIKMMDDYYKKNRFERIKQSKQIKKLWKNKER